MIKEIYADRNGPVLAQTSQLTAPQPLPRQSSTWEESPEDDLGDDTDLPQPHFSIAVDDATDADDSFDQAAPRLSMPFDDGEITGRSIEVARNVTTEFRNGRSPRQSLMSGVPSDRWSDGSVTGVTDIVRCRPNDIIGQPFIESDENEAGDVESRLEVG